MRIVREVFPFLALSVQNLLLFVANIAGKLLHRIAVLRAALQGLHNFVVFEGSLHGGHALLWKLRENNERYDIMADVIVELKVMPKSPKTNLKTVLAAAEKLVSSFGARLIKHEEQPIAFGLKALMLTILFDENKGSTDTLEEHIGKVKGVESVMVTGVSRALG